MITALDNLTYFIFTFIVLMGIDYTNKLNKPMFLWAAIASLVVIVANFI
jgi:hypothetical protein